MAISYTGQRLARTRTALGSASDTFPLTTSATAGSLLVMVTANPNDNLSTVTDSLGNTWTIQKQNNSRAVAWTTQNMGPLTTSDTLTLTWATAINQYSVLVDEFSGITASSPVDTSAAASHAAETGRHGPAVTTSNADDLIYSAFPSYGATESSFTAGSGYTAVASYKTTPTSISEAQYQIVSATGTYTPDATGGVSVAYYGVTIAFKASSAADATVTGVRAAVAAAGSGGQVSTVGGGTIEAGFYGTALYGSSAYGGDQPNPPPPDWSGIEVLGPDLPELDVLVDVTVPPLTAGRQYTSIVQNVRSLSWTRSGRNDEFERTSPGSLSLVLDNRNDMLTDLGIRKAQWVCVKALWNQQETILWTGIITSLPQTWPASGSDAVVQLSAADTLYIMRLADLAGATYPTQRGDQRINTILSNVTGFGGQNVNIIGSLDGQSDTIDAVTTPLSVGSDALSQALAIEASDNGLLIATGHGLIDYQGRHWRALNAKTSLLVLGETTGEIPYRDSVTYEDDDSRLANVVNVTPVGANDPVTAIDTNVQQNSFVRRNQSVDRQLLSSNTSLAQSAAEYLLNRYKDPPPRVPQVEVELAAVQAVASSQIQTILNLANSQRITWQRAAVNPISVDCHVEQVSHTVLPGTSWTVRLQLSPAVRDAIWILGDTVNSKLGQTTAITY